MQMRNKISRAVVLSAMCGFVGAAFAQGPGYSQGPQGGPGYGHHMGPGYGAQGHGPGGRGPGMMQGRGGSADGAGRREHMARALGLSEDQRAKAARIMEGTRRKNWDVRGQILSERFKLREMVRGDKVDPDAVVEQKRKIDDLKRQVMRSRLEARNQVFALLTPEQREKARSFGPPRRPGRGNG